MRNYGFFKVAAAVPLTEVANPVYNAKEIENLLKRAAKLGVGLVVFPELSLSSYSCSDLFFLADLEKTVLNELKRLAKLTGNLKIAAFIGLPLLIENKLFNCCALLADGKIKGIMPKNNIPNYGEYYELRWFCPGGDLTVSSVNLFGENVPIGQNLIFKINDAYVSAEICEDLWSSDSSARSLCKQGATVICNLSASSAVISKKTRRLTLIKSSSFLNKCAYIFSSAGISESTTDTLYSGHCIIAENGNILKQKTQTEFKSGLIVSDIDLERLISDRKRINTFKPQSGAKIIEVSSVACKTMPSRKFSKTPFIPQTEPQRDKRIDEITKITSLSLAKRLKHTQVKHPVIGVSGGLDSTLALMTAADAMDVLNLPRNDIIAVTMPGFGTSDETYKNSQLLMRALGVGRMEIDIKKACEVHFNDIRHDKNIKNTVYENAQVRERTQILLDIANKENGLLVGTGDLSELALGFCTYAGDHISMYAVNSSIPKTLVRQIVKYKADSLGGELKNILYNILKTPVSPELLPPGKDGEITQQTERLLGDYILHDFFLYYFIRFGFSIDKIRFLAKTTFKNDYSQSEIDKTLKVFVKRFFSQQFKRSCMPDGPKIGSVTLSPRSDWKMPSDASPYIFSEN